MCIGMQSSPSYPNVGPRDTSNELIKSDYELSDENADKNAKIMAARNRAQSLIKRDRDGPNIRPLNPNRPRYTFSLKDGFKRVEDKETVKLGPTNRGTSIT